jgi:hypothetical protein
VFITADKNHMKPMILVARLIAEEEVDELDHRRGYAMMKYQEDGLISGRPFDKWAAVTERRQHPEYPG